MRRIKIAQIGINRYSHGPELFLTMRLRPDIFDLVGYVLVEDERETCAGKIASYFGNLAELSLREVLEDPTIEAVTIETDEIHLLKYAQMAAEHGKHIHMEKPGSQSLADFERLIETMRRTKKVFHMGYMFRYNPMIVDTVRRVRDGELGHVFSVEAQMSRHDDRACREWLGAFRGGMMFYLGSNLIDVVLRLQGVPEQVIPLNTATGIDGVGSEDFGLAVLRYPAATSFVRTSGTEVDGGARRQIVVLGERGTVVISPIEGNDSRTTARMSYYAAADVSMLDENGRTVREHRDSGPFGRYEAMICAFAEMVCGERKNPYTLDYELTLFRTVLACCGEPV